ncbi:ImmA/IrrE family metallo-endopeptidase [Desulfitobacterium sp. Sab5]|uniref:ImmA/IrrE family metallo-endopeptidase n=1 Tax=Desulfitobacterium nosdiversum TaxID=3375356 RepID=UPI003CF55F05
MDYIRQSVESLMAKYRTNDPYQLAKEMDIEVIPYSFSHIKGLVINMYGKIIIALNSNHPEILQRAALAHELGHFTLSPTGVGYFFLSDHTLMESKVEYEANRFMVELLAGEEEPNINETIGQFATRLGIPREMIRLIK